jgi:hypothetical protein
MIELAVAVQMKGLGSAFDSRRYSRMARMSSGTLQNGPEPGHGAPQLAGPQRIRGTALRRCLAAGIANVRERRTGERQVQRWLRFVWGAEVAGPARSRASKARGHSANQTSFG